MGIGRHVTLTGVVISEKPNEFKEAALEFLDATNDS